MQQTFLKIVRSDRWGYVLFWAWNAIFLAFLLLGFAPLVLPGIVLATVSGILPVSFAVTALLLLIIPLSAVGLGVMVLRSQPRKLFALGYAVEGPLMLLVFLRLFVVRELTPMLTFVFAVAALGMLAFLWQLLDTRIDARGVVATHLRLLGVTLFALVAVYVAIWLAFYALPFAVYLVRGLVDLVLHIGDVLVSFWRALFDFPRNMYIVPFTLFVLMGMLTFAFSATLFVLMPIAVPVLVLRAWRDAVKNYTGRFGTVGAAMLTGAAVGVCVLLYVFLNQQPQPLAFALLEANLTNPAQARQLAAQENTIRAGLLNAYLAPQRYVSSNGEVQHIRDMYAGAFGLDRNLFIGVEQAYQTVAAPLLYQPAIEAVEYAGRNDGAIHRESTKAAQLYEDYFDETIFNGERETVLTALGSTWDVGGAQQAIQDADDREVHLNTQEINFVEHGDMADFELHEEYQNESGTRQEVVYYITLPESAVITGVWLGNSDKRDERAVYRVSPRGAAQQVYREQVRQQVDPALVEQIGPRQYRVRVFPIEPKSIQYRGSEFGAQDISLRQGPPLHLWLTWRVMASENGWTLPYLAEKRNVYWDGKTKRTVKGAAMTVNADAWLPSSLPATAVATPATHRFDLSDGQTVVAQPIASALLPTLPNDLQLAIVLDRSRSMLPLAQEVQNALTQLRALAERGDKIDVYLTASKYRGEAPARVALDALSPDALLYVGGQNPAELLQQFGSLRGGAKYDAVFVLTDGTGYALGANDSKPASVTAPLWFVHLGGKFPLGYDDPTLQEIQSTGGGVTGTLAEALNRYAVALAVERGETFANAPQGAASDWVDNYVWLTLPTNEAQTRFAGTASDENFAPFAARRLILTNIEREHAALEQLNTLDQLHALAKQYSVVSPYSSMIVLINQFQEQTLDELEKQGDRFHREVEEVGQTTSPFDVTAVPEPHEYVLMALGVALLVWYGRKKRQRRTA